MNLADLKPFIDQKWSAELLPRLIDYIRIPAKSPAFDASWSAHGHLARVVSEARAWAQTQAGGASGASGVLAGMIIEIVQIEGKTPCIFFDVPSTQGAGNAQTVLFYGHLDKQPEMSGWREDLGPWKPVVEDGKLYGRGGADDGYAIYAALTAIAALDSQAITRPRCVGLIESCEESGSFDLPAYLDLLGPRMGDVKLVDGPGFGLRKLRPIVGDDLAARPGRRHSFGRDSRRRSAFRKRQWHRAFFVSNRAASAESDR